LEAVRSDKKPTEAAKPPPTRAAPSKPLPKINEGVETPSTGTRRAVAADAPAAVGESFFADTRVQATDGPGAGGGSGGKTSAPPPKVMAPAKAAPAPQLLKTAGPSTVKALLAERQKAAASVESVGSEQISKSAVSDAADIVSKVAGATVVEGKYAVIRGLTDRYSAATLNGAELPSADPYRRSASLDMFPTKIIDRVNVTKTFTPDQPGSFTGGNIDIVTKSFPDKPFFSFELGGSYNTQSSLRDDFLSYDGGSTDWLGMDDGTRALPAAVKRYTDANRQFPTKRNSVPLSNPTRLAEQATLNSLTEALGPAQFAGVDGKSWLNHSFVIAGGDTTHLLGNPLGFFASLPYSRSYSLYDDGQGSRYVRVPGGDLELKKSWTEVKASDEVNWAATANLAYQFFEQHQVSFNYLFNQYAEDVARVRNGYDLDLDFDRGNVQQNRLHFTERDLSSFQFKGTHAFPELANVKFDWLATFTDTTQDEPDVRFFNTLENQFGVSGLPDPSFPARYFRALEENNRNLKFDFTVPFNQWNWDSSEFKLGYFNSFAERSYDELVLYYDGDSRTVAPNDFLAPGSVGYGSMVTNSSSVFYTWPSFLRNRFDKSFYTGELGVQAGYVMVDMPVLSKLRLVAGARYEMTDLTVTSFSTLPSTSVPAGATNRALISEAHLLPAVGLIFSLRSNMNVRLGYGKTIARPSFRELAGIRSYDPVLDEILEGNPALTMSEADNFDLRWEWYPRPGELFSVSFFYKDILAPIEKKELQAGGAITYFNNDYGKVYGLELEARKSLDFLDANLRNFSLGGNISLIRSEAPVVDRDYIISLGGPDDEVRPLSDQSPYIINFDLSYDNAGSGTSISLSYNVFGPRLDFQGLNFPDIYEQPSAQLDLVVSQRLSRHLRLKFGARNLLNPSIEKTFGASGEAIYSSYKRGRSFGLSLTYDF
ncbi:MAG TPA: TonB-dependent receptor, partial [Methylomirabilota bacterium]|nr:TonB-dependent receptor [Methylomirabilota bacterium]